MIEADLSSVAIEALQEGENRDKIFRLIWVQNLDLRDHQFRVLFKLDEPNGRYVTTKIAPELLFMFAPGAYFLNGQRLEHPPEEGSTMEISLETLQGNPFRTVSHAFSDDLYDLRHSWVGYSKSQYCVVIETDNAVYIFPCFVLGSAYYFTSASMCRQLFAQSLDGLYEPGSIHVDPVARRAEIHLKPNAADGDAPDIIRFATEPIANRHWHSIVNRLRSNQHKTKGKGDPNVPFMADFPVAAKLSMVVRAIKCYDPKLKKERILVMEIKEENSPFDFDQYLRMRTVGPPQIEDVGKTSTRRGTSNVISTRKPSPNLVSIEIKNYEPPKNVNKRHMMIEKQYEEDPERKEIGVPDKVHDAGQADVSVRDPSRDGDAEVRHGEIKPPEPDEMEVRHKECLSLNDFQAMAVPLAKEDNVQDFRIIGPIAMPKRVGDKLRGSLWEYADKEHTISRRYMAVTLIYKSAHACLIEIDQNGLPSPTATYVLISAAGDQMSLQEIREFLGKVVKREILESIAANYLRRGYILYPKKHPENKTDEQYQAWRNTLLSRITTLGRLKDR